MPAIVRRTKAEPTASNGGNSRGGKMPRCATISQAPPTTTNGKAVRAMTRQRASSVAPGIAETVAEAGEAGTASYMAGWSVKPRRPAWPWRCVAHEFLPHRRFVHHRDHRGVRFRIDASRGRG